MITLKRFFAYLIDINFVVVLSYFYMSKFGTSTPGGTGYTLSGIYSMPLLLIWYGYFVVLEVNWQTSIGKKIFKLYVRKLDGTKLTLVDIIIRRSLDLIELFFMPLITMISVLVTQKHQRIGDIFAKTVVQER
jgi:uncharacterized RDD family membrane protein YckC